MSSSTTRHRRTGRGLVEVAPASWDDDEVTNFYAPARDLETQPRIRAHVATSQPPRAGARPAVPREAPRLHAPPLHAPPLHAPPLHAPPLHAPPLHAPRPPASYPQISRAREAFGREFIRERSGLTSALPWIAVAALIVALGMREFSSVPQAGTAIVPTVPSDALVSIDGKELEQRQSPFQAQKLAPEIDHVIEISRQGFVSQTRRVRLHAGELRVLPSVELEPAVADTGFLLRSDPPAAAIIIDGQRRTEVTPARIVDLEAGRHAVRLEYARRPPWESTIEVARGQVLDLPLAQLQAREPGRNERASVQRATGRRAAMRAPRPNSRVRPAGRARTRAEKAESTVAANAPARAHGVLRVNSLPWADVYVNDLRIGATPQLDLRLPAGRHKVRLVNPEFELVKGFSVQIEAGKTLTKTVQLVD
jgi:hypothetical protein